MNTNINLLRNTKNFYRWVVLMVFLVSGTFHGQDKPKLQVSESDYDLWGQLYDKQLAPNGDWASFSMAYDSGKDTLFIKNTRDLNSYNFPNGYNGSFNSNGNWFAYNLKSKGVGLFNLSKKQNKIIPNGKKYVWSNLGRYVAITSDNHELFILDLLEGTQIELHAVQSFSFNFVGDRLAYIQNENLGNSVNIIKLMNGKDSLQIHKSVLPISNLEWHQSSNSLIFLEAFNDSRYTEKSHVIYYYDKTLRSFDHRKQHGFPKDTRVSNISIIHISDFFVSKGNDRVFFPIEKWHLKSDTLSKHNPHKLEVWHYKDTEIHPRKKNFEFNKLGVKLAGWELTNDRFFQITSPEHPFYLMNHDHTHALLYSLQEYLPRFKYHGEFSDYYLLDFNTLDKSLFLKKQPLGSELIASSPTGRHFVYYRDHQWWIYDINNKEHVNISKDITEPLYIVHYSNHPLSYPVWSQGDSDVIITGRHDIWKVNINQQKTQRMTQGKEKGLTYKLHHGINIEPKSRRQQVLRKFPVSDLNFLIVQSIDPITRAMGFYILDKNEELKTIDYGDKLISDFMMDNNRSAIIYQEQTFDKPPKLMLWKNGSSQEFFQSNTHHDTYQWGTSKIIHYTNSKNDSLQGVLYYPADYYPEKKYPLIVNIYEKQSRYYNFFFNPSLYSNDESLVSTLTLNGYFVLLPDITYQEGHVGTSAADCVIAATKKALQNNAIDPKGIGLMGHSHGGYQTNFIISQTNLFSAAISGSGFSELFSWSLSVMSGFSNRPEMDFFEFGQTRMAKPYYDAMENYIANSPIHQIKSIQTPLLIWFGKNDLRVNWEQGLYLHLALRRSNKENILLVYPNETHVLTQKPNQKDLHTKIQDWFDHHLKKKEAKDWMAQINQY